MKALGRAMGLAAIAYVLTAVLALLLRLAGLASPSAWWAGTALVSCGWLSICGWVLWHARREAEAPQGSEAVRADPPLPRQPIAGPGPLDWAGEVDYLLESADLRVLAQLAADADAQAGLLTAAVQTAWQHGSFEVELAARARAAQAAAEVANTHLAFARIVAAERLRSSRSGLVG
jgi:hypothetical protein